MDHLTFDTVVIGTGAAGYNAANEIRKLCEKSVCIVTEGKSCGTSRNTGSDKQTYYKLTLSGDTPDSVRRMAEDLFNGGAVDGDNALCEAALSVRCFNNLCSLGVPFPVNRYGEYIGYKTDHDPFMRATSAGPLTSKFMTEALERQAEKLAIPIFDDLLAVEILKNGNLPSVHFHALRHSFASCCIKLGFDIKALSEILGHSSVEITLNRYVHSSFEQKAEYMKRLEFAV